MPTESGDLTREDLEFLRRAESLKNSYAKIKRAKTLIAEARTEIAHALGRGAPVPQGAKTAPKKAQNKAPTINYSVDLPATMSDNERKVYAELQKAGIDGRKPRELAEALKLSINTIGRATTTLAKRKLIAATGQTLNRTWKVR